MGILEKLEEAKKAKINWTTPIQSDALLKPRVEMRDYDEEEWKEGRLIAIHPHDDPNAPEFNGESDYYCEDKNWEVRVYLSCRIPLSQEGVDESMKNPKGKEMNDEGFILEIRDIFGIKESVKESEDIRIGNLACSGPFDSNFKALYGDENLPDSDIGLIECAGEFQATEDAQRDYWMPSDVDACKRLHDFLSDNLDDALNSGIYYVSFFAELISNPNVKFNDGWGNGGLPIPRSLLFYCGADL